LSTSFTSDNSGSAAHVAYLGFDRNDYPGDSSLKLLRGKSLLRASGSTTHRARATIRGRGNAELFKNSVSASWSSSTVARLLRLGRLPMQLSWALLMVRWQSHQHATKDSQQERLSFSTKRKEGGCSQSSGLIFTLGQMPCNPKGLERACTVPASLLRKARVLPSSPPRTFDKTQVEDSSRTG